MNCTSCGANLPQGAAQCPLCGNPTPYNVAKPASSPQYDPTVVTPQPGPGNPPQIDPTIAASPFGGTPPPPSTAYGTPSYGTRIRLWYATTAQTPQQTRPDPRHHRAGARCCLRWYLLRGLPGTETNRQCHNHILKCHKHICCCHSNVGIECHTNYRTNHERQTNHIRSSSFRPHH